MKDKIESVLESSNWTGITLRQHISDKRVSLEPHDLWPWIKAHEGEPKSIEEMREQMCLMAHLIQHVKQEGNES